MKIKITLRHRACLRVDGGAAAATTGHVRVTFFSVFGIAPRNRGPRSSLAFYSLLPILSEDKQRERETERREKASAVVPGPRPTAPAQAFIEHRQQHRCANRCYHISLYFVPLSFSLPWFFFLFSKHAWKFWYLFFSFILTDRSRVWNCAISLKLEQSNRMIKQICLEVIDPTNVEFLILFFSNNSKVFKKVFHWQLHKLLSKITFPRNVKERYYPRVSFLFLFSLFGMRHPLGRRSH